MTPAPRPADGLLLTKFMTKKPPKAEPTLVYDFAAMAGMGWKNPDPPMSYEQLQEKDAQRRADEDRQRAELYQRRADAKTQIEKEAVLRSATAAQQRRDWENGLPVPAAPPAR
jgi:hypothetical protein